MAHVSKTVQRACRVLKERIRFREAHLRLPGSSMDDDDTLKIQLATEVYVDSWVIPLLDAIESGDTYQLNRLLNSI